MTNSQSQFASKAYVVTGGASGIGLSVAQRLLELSAIVHVVDITSTAPTFEAISSSGRIHFHLSTDVSSRESVKRAFQSILEISPRLHGLVACAGISSLSLSTIDSDESFDRVMAVNVRGTWNAGTDFPDTGDFTEGLGSLVTTGSTASFQAGARIAAYCTSKHAIVGLTKAWAQDFASKGVRVNCVAPGLTDTPALKAYGHAMPADVINHFLQGVPMKRLALGSEIAEAVVFLLGSGSSFMTGQIIPINGGAV
ncbi:unnamed protein product [Penicillium bialowiezense]